MANEGYYSESSRHYLQARQEYPKVLNQIDEKFKETMKSIDSCLRQGDIPFDVLMVALLYLVDNNKKIAETILANRKEVGGSNQVLQMVREYFKLSRKTLDSLSNVRKSLGVYKNKLLLMAVRDCHGQVGIQEAVRCAEGVQDDLLRSLPSLIGEHVVMLRSLQQAKGQAIPTRAVSPTTSTARKWAAIMLVSVFTTAVICSILLAAFHAPPVLVAVSGAIISITSWGPFTRWLDDFWTLERRAPERMSVGNSRNVATEELEEIERPTVDWNKKMVKNLLKKIAKLDAGITKCQSKIRKAQAQFL